MISQSWGKLGVEITAEGASSREWKLRFERRLAPRDDSRTANAASSVWLVRDLSSSRLYAAKRQMVASLDEVDALVDEAAAWRAACLADRTSTIPELVDVFVVRSGELSVTFLIEFCARGLLPREKGLSEAVLLTIVVDLAEIAATLPSPHGHIAYESLLVDEKGRLKLAGFGAHRSAILRDNPGLKKQDDAFDIGLLLFELVFEGQPDETLSVPQSSAYSSRLTEIIAAAFQHVDPGELKRMAQNAGGEHRAPVINVEKKDEPEKDLPIHVSRATERNVERLTKGVDIGTSFSALLNDMSGQPEAVASAVFKTLFKEPVSKDPVCAMRVLTMLHNLMLDGPPTMLAAVRKNDKFMEWTESSWTREAIDGGKDASLTNSDVICFIGGELAFYAAALRRKARFHMLAAGGFSGRWDRTGALNSEGRDVLVTRRRRVIGGMADLAEMFSELGCRLAGATDTQASVKQAALGAMVSECCLAATAGVNIVLEMDTARDAQKVEEGIGRLHRAARSLVFAVEKVPSAGGEQWVEQFADESPPDVVANAEAKEQEAVGIDVVADIPNEGWGETEGLVAKKEKKALKKERKKQKKAESEKKAERALEEKSTNEDITAADGALVVHDSGDAAAAAVATMFGDLLSIDEGSSNHAVVSEAPRLTTNMSNAQALASAFGVSVEAVGGEHLALPPPEGFDDEEEGGYDTFRARQEEHHARQRQSREVRSTAMWAARSQHSGDTLVVSNGAKKKSHPVFCQCAICQQQEAQAIAEETELAARNDNSGRQTNEGYRKGYISDDELDMRDESESFRGRREMRYFGDEHRDSLDDDSRPGQAILLGTGGDVDHRKRDSFYDDYDSYESVTFSVEDEPPLHPQGGETIAPALPVQPQTTLKMPQRSSPAFTPDPKLSLSLKRLRTGDRLSESETVAVHKGEYNRETVVIKKLLKGAVESKVAVEAFTNEVKVMSMLSHPALLKCIAVSLQKPNYMFVTEFMKRGTLFDVLHKSHIKLTWALIRKIAMHIAQGMEHMHSRGVLHRDLKSLNIFVDGSYNVKIGDFGLSQHVSEASQSGINGTYQYMAPEVLRGGPHSTKSDVYSYAQVLCEVVSGSPPYHGIEAREVAERVVTEDIRPPIPMQCQRAYVNLIQMCWGTVPATRPSFTEIIELIKTTTK